jgi:hypothetical protein
VLSYRIDSVSGIVEIEGPTAQDLQAFKTFFAGVIADPQYRQGFGFLRHGRGMNAPQTEILRRAVDYLTRVPGVPSSRWAIVVETPADYGMMRMAETLSSGAAVEVRIFWALEEARRWLREAQAAGVSLAGERREP